eukprot:scaffold7381_cov310-Pinguiococcus_pyrenoidosus.AAC.71
MSVEQRRRYSWSSHGWLTESSTKQVSVADVQADTVSSWLTSLDSVWSPDSASSMLLSTSRCIAISVLIHVANLRVAGEPSLPIGCSPSLARDLTGLRETLLAVGSTFSSF